LNSFFPDLVLVWLEKVACHFMRSPFVGILRAVCIVSRQPLCQCKEKLIHQTCPQFKGFSFPWGRKSASYPVDGHLYASREATASAKPLLYRRWRLCSWRWQASDFVRRKCSWWWLRVWEIWCFVWTQKRRRRSDTSERSRCLRSLTERRLPPWRLVRALHHTLRAWFGASKLSMPFATYYLNYVTYGE